jgi:hypothetical protein
MKIRYACLAAAGLAVAGCGVGDKVGEIPSDAAQTKLIQPDCYTVDPYVPPKIAAPRKDVPDAMSAFSGKWGGGAWDGTVCHDLYVLQVESSGTVVMFDAHGPGFSHDATAFTRRGEIGEDGRLRVRKGHAMVEYWIEDGRLHGVRKQRNHENKIIMSKL